MSSANTSRPMVSDDSRSDIAAADDAAGVPRTIVIGDVHGCIDELTHLLETCAVDWASDQVILVGDLVAKGPDSQAVVQLARERDMRAVLGNHDSKVLTYAGVPGRDAKPLKHPKLHELVARTLRADDWTYLRSLPLYLPVPQHDSVVVHAGLVAGLPLDQQPRDLMTNLRSVTRAGEPSKRVEGGVPWASVWPGPVHVVFGHDAVRGLQRHPFATGLDTGCVYGGSLTALILPQRRLVSVAARRAYVPFMGATS